MTAKAIVWDGSFGDTTLPKIGLGFAPALPNALYDWASDGLTDGVLSTWASSTNGAALAADSGGPIVVPAGGGKAVRFNGTNDRMRIPFALSGAQTLVAVFRFTAAPRVGDSVLYGYTSISEGAMSVGPGIDSFAGHGGGQYILPVPSIPGDTSWHVALVTINGSSSAFRVDGIDVPGTLPAATRAGLTLGFSAATGGRASIEYKRVAVLAGGTSGWQRDSIVNQLRARYGI